MFSFCISPAIMGTVWLDSKRGVMQNTWGFPQPATVGTSHPYSSSWWARVKICIRSQKFLDPKFFWTQNFFEPNIFLDQKFFLDTKFFLDPTFFLDPKFFRPKFFRDQKLFWTQIFSDPKLFSGPKFVHPLWKFILTI